jgi:hypothetical protein
LSHQLIALLNLRFVIAARSATIKLEARSRQLEAYFLFAVAFFEAFSGSTVVEPANPRRSRGGALAFEIST